MTKLEQQIEEMKAKLAEMEAEVKKSKEFKWKYVKHKTFRVTDCYVADCQYGDEANYILNGSYRKTKANAELSLKRNREANLIEALAEQFGSDGSGVHVIERAGSTYSSGLDDITVGIPRMTEEIADKVCEVLNNKQVIL